MYVQNHHTQEDPNQTAELVWFITQTLTTLKMTHSYLYNNMFTKTKHCFDHHP